MGLSMQRFYWWNHMWKKKKEEEGRGSEGKEEVPIIWSELQGHSECDPWWSFNHSLASHSQKP
jgi:hypothetical protein